MSELIMTVGLPGSGKTTWAKQQEGYTVFSSDDIREELGANAKNDKVFKALHNKIKLALSEGKNCIYDATNIASKKRRHALKNFDCKKTAMVFVEPFDIIREQNEARGRSVPPEVIRKMLFSWQTPILQEGFDEIKLIGYPYDWDFNDMDQDNGHHALSLIDHLIKAEKLLPPDSDIIIRRAAFYHDIGKYWTKSFTDSLGYPTLEAHYYNHENVGAYMYLLNHDSVDVSGLITWHMRPFVWDEHPNVKEKDRKWMGEDFIKKLEILHKADMEAK